MIITLDGPSASGKTTVAELVAADLGYHCLKTGEMYRAVGLEAHRQRLPLDRVDAVIQIAESINLSFDWTRARPTLLIDGYAPLGLLDLPEITEAAKLVSEIPQVRLALVKRQQQIGRDWPNLVAEGRDQGSFVFPDAPHKFYLTATDDCRAKRRQEKWLVDGIVQDLEEVRRTIAARDAHDRQTLERMGLEVIPAGAMVIDSTQIPSAREVADLIVSSVKAKRI
jgi:cytidylate kinase